LFNKVVAKIFGTSNERELKRIMPLIESVNVLEPEIKRLTDDQLRAKTEEFRQRIRERVDAIEDVDEKDQALKASLTRFCRKPSPWFVREAGECADAALRHATGGRHRPAPRQDRRDEDG